MRPAAGKTSRFAFLDALRGLAALGVMAYHIERYEPETRVSHIVMPGFVDATVQFGWIGVQFLLVISGFVIAASFRDMRATASSIGNFLLRRFIRLTPPYWTTLLVVLLLHQVSVSLHWFPSPIDGPLSWARAGSHVIYAQDMLGQKSLSAGLWTVCIELQFYVLFSAGLLIAQQVFPRFENGRAAASPVGLMAVFAPMAILSLFVWNRDSELEPWVIYYFSLFFLGMMTWWALDGRIPRGWYWLTVAVLVARVSWEWKLELMLGLMASLALYSAGRLGHLNNWLNIGWLQYLGRISYSLYLIHYPVAHVVTHVGWTVMGGTPSSPAAAACLAMALCMSVGAAHLLHRWVEAPSIEWAAWFKQRPSVESIVPGSRISQAAEHNHELPGQWRKVELTSAE